MDVKSAKALVSPLSPHLLLPARGIGCLVGSTERLNPTQVLHSVCFTLPHRCIG